MIEVNELALSGGDIDRVCGPLEKGTVSLLALPQRALGPPALGDLGPQCFVGSCQLRGPFLHPNFQLVVRSAQRILRLLSLDDVSHSDRRGTDGRPLPPILPRLYLYENVAFQDLVIGFALGRLTPNRFLPRLFPEGEEIAGRLRAAGVEKLVELPVLHIHDPPQVPGLHRPVGPHDAPPIVYQADQLGE